MVITKDYIDSLNPPKEQRIKISDNLILKVTRHKDFYLGTTGKLVKKLGRYPEMGLEEAIRISSRNIKNLGKIYLLYKESKASLDRRTKRGNDNLFSYKQIESPIRRNFVMS